MTAYRRGPFAFASRFRNGANRCVPFKKSTVALPQRRKALQKVRHPSPGYLNDGASLTFPFVERARAVAFCKLTKILSSFSPCCAVAGRVQTPVLNWYFQNRFVTSGREFPTTSMRHLP